MCSSHIKHTRIGLAQEYFHGLGLKRLMSAIFLNIAFLCMQAVNDAQPQGADAELEACLNELP
jgi:hypothetical protein